MDGRGESIALLRLLIFAAQVGIPLTGGLSAIGIVVSFGTWLVRCWMTTTTAYELTTQGKIVSRLDSVQLVQMYQELMPTLFCFLDSCGLLPWSELKPD